MDVCWNRILGLPKEKEYTDPSDMQETLKYHFMSPLDKWKDKKRFPGKFLLHVISIILITIQVRADLHDRIDYVTKMYVGYTHTLLEAMSFMIIIISQGT